MFDLTFNVPSLIMAASAIVTLIVWLVRLEGRVGTANTEAGEARAAAVEAATKTEAAHALVLLHKEQFHAYQLEAAEKFMTQSAVGEIKRELLGELNRIEGRLEAQIDRLIEGRT